MFYTWKSIVAVASVVSLQNAQGTAKAGRPHSRLQKRKPPRLMFFL